MVDPASEIFRAALAKQCFTIFEGGGAKGITHLGALKALEDVGLARIGTAGTSAGAIIAALNAVGYSADELFKSGTDNILVRRGLAPVDLLGRDDWGVFSRLRASPSETGVVRLLRVLRGKLILSVLALLSPIIPIWVFCLARTTGRPQLLASAWRIIDEFGFFSTESARDILNTLLCEKLGLPEGTLVCFRHVDPERAGCCRLKIITTNLRLGGLDLFDDATPDVVVADAVAASFSIPIFFKPTRIRRVDPESGKPLELPDIYADGGLISNLPVWVFFEDKKALERLVENRDQRPLPIVAFQLEDAGTNAQGKGQSVLLALFSYVGTVLRTGIFGGQSIAENFVTHLTIVALPTKLGVVQFDCSGQDAMIAHESGREAAGRKLRTVFRDNPYERRAILEKLIKQARALSPTIRTDGIQAAFRACVVRRLGNRSFKVIASINMEGDADDDLVLDQRNPAAPTAFLDREVTYVDAKAPHSDLRMTKYELALLRPTLAGVISIPIFETREEWSVLPPTKRQEPKGVLCIDSDAPLKEEYDSKAFLKMLASAAVDLAPYMVFERETS